MALTFHIIGILKNSKCNKQEINTFLEEKNHQRKLLQFNLHLFLRWCFGLLLILGQITLILKFVIDKTG